MRRYYNVRYYKYGTYDQNDGETNLVYIQEKAFSANFPFLALCSHFLSASRRAPRIAVFSDVSV